MTQAYAAAVESLRPSAPAGTSEAARLTVERAVGLLAGRARCRLAEAHRHLLRMAAEEDRALLEVASGVIRLLDVSDPDTGIVSGLDTSRPEVRLPAPVRRFAPWIGMVQRVLDVAPGMSSYLSAERGPDGRLVDLTWAAVSPEAVAPNGLRGAQLLGLRISEHFPEVVASDRWAVYQHVLDSGAPSVLGPFRHMDGTYTVRAHRLGEGLLLNWTRHDERAAGLAERLASTERLGNLGWGEWDLVSGEVYWSDHLYRIFGRDPRLGPADPNTPDGSGLEEDEPLRVAAKAQLDRGDRVDVITRVRVNGRIKHLRTVADAVRDAGGRPLRIFGIVQDVTEQETGAKRLAEVERQLDEQRRSLAAEHELAARLQRIILPLPEGPIVLPGLKVALRYLPAGQESLVGGDWYHAAELRDGSVLLAVGDVAGHGTQAATAMAQLRHALRALAVTTSDPGQLLGHLNKLTCDLERESPEMAATAVVARFDPARHEIVWAQAGHPPPLLSRGGRTRVLDRPAGPMLGVVEEAVYPTARLDFRVGDVLLLYTDGLVEHRRRGPDDGLASVIATVDEAVRASPDQPLTQLLARLRQTNPDDDTCILAARPVTGETQDLRRYLTGATKKSDLGR
ncbi:SpoIIE family protein phosphatase [Actinoplanes sp. LDG1-06]|uniref:SpoIIE family protein phosphatase n=1 Tax=Paractinoplanes ovalisporus TaxID=2810368 RepID=A0ABS2AS25_9ACTN|nr:SpoIIE family protein phosphatase [Actinoplanes ovalisporus]MBM2622682.1 SpoIIE family protein phosphatase [Actinoplanes ovalisporus]